MHSHLHMAAGNIEPPSPRLCPLWQWTKVGHIPGWWDKHILRDVFSVSQALVQLLNYLSLRRVTLLLAMPAARLYEWQPVSPSVHHFDSLLNGLPLNLVLISMVSRGWILMTLVIP